MRVPAISVLLCALKAVRAGGAMRAAAGAWLLAMLAGALPARGAEPYDYRPARVAHGELRVLERVPVLVLEGTPEEMGRAEGRLVGAPIRELLVFPQVMLQLTGRFAGWERFVALARGMEPQFPADHRREFEALVEASGIDRTLALVANTMTDIYRGGLGCSSLLVEGSRSGSGQPMFGRNLDFFGGGMLDRYSLVTVYRPPGKHALVSIGFPGLVGCLSGMNDAGLALAVHEVLAARDGALLYNPQGIPYTLLFRRILEECATVDAAEALLRAAPRSTQLNLAVCDRRQAAVLEMTPRTVVRRPTNRGLVACTNHFRSDELAVGRQCWRHDELLEAAKQPTIDVAAVAAKLRAVASNHLTLQSMIFEPGPLVLHVAFGHPPAASHTLRRLELAGLLGGAGEGRPAGRSPASIPTPAGALPARPLQ